MTESNFKLITYEDKGYDKKLYPNLMLNILKVLRGLISINTPIRNLNQGNFHRSFHVCVDQCELKIN